MPLERARPVQASDTGHPGDDALLRQMAQEASLITPRRWTHFLFFPDRDAALAVADALAGEWDIDLLASPDDTGWTVQATRQPVQVGPIAVTRARAELTDLAARHGGEYDGWRAWV